MSCVFFKVVDGVEHCIDAVLKISHSCIALMAQKSSNFFSIVAVVNHKLDGFISPPSRVIVFTSADGADATLILEHGIVLFWSDSVFIPNPPIPSFLRTFIVRLLALALPCQNSSRSFPVTSGAGEKFIRVCRIRNLHSMLNLFFGSLVSISRLQFDSRFVFLVVLFPVAVACLICHASNI